MIRNHVRILGLFLALVLGAAAYGAMEKDNDALGIDTAKVSLVQAVTTAEQHANGKASRAAYEKSAKHGPAYDVEVVSGPKVFDVSVDAQTGAVLSSKEDQPDHHRHGDEEDDDDE